MTLTLLYRRLTLLATADLSLVALAIACFELAWRSDAPGHEAIVAQTPAKLVALAVISGSSDRLVLYRLFMLRNVLPLLDYDDNKSISKFKMLLPCCRLQLRKGSLLVGGGGIRWGMWWCIGGDDSV